MRSAPGVVSTNQTRARRYSLFERVEVGESGHDAHSLAGREECVVEHVKAFANAGYFGQRRSAGDLVLALMHPAQKKGRISCCSHHALKVAKDAQFEYFL